MCNVGIAAPVQRLARRLYRRLQARDLLDRRYRKAIAIGPERHRNEVDVIPKKVRVLGQAKRAARSGDKAGHVGDQAIVVRNCVVRLGHEREIANRQHLSTAPQSHRRQAPTLLAER